MQGEDRLFAHCEVDCCSLIEMAVLLPMGLVSRSECSVPPFLLYFLNLFAKKLFSFELTPCLAKPAF